MLVGEIICDPSVLREVYPLFLFDGGEMASTISGGPECFWTSAFAVLFLLYRFLRVFVVRMRSAAPCLQIDINDMIGQWD